MGSRILYRQRAERFAQLLDEANGGRRHHVRTRVDDDLADLVTLGQGLRTADMSTGINPDFRADLRAMLVAAAEREGIGATSGTGPMAEHDARPTGSQPPARTLLRPVLGVPRSGIRGRGARARGVILAGVAAGAIAVSGMSAASENAIPGDALYGVKRSTERAQLALASSDLSRGQLFLDFARTRLAEAKAVRGDSVGFTAVLNDMDADTRQGIKLLTASAVARRDTAVLDAIGSFLNSQRQQVTELLTGASRAERERADGSLALLDSIRRRADGLRIVLACDLDPAPRADALGPIPHTACLKIGGQSGTPQDEQTGGRPVDQPHPERNDPATSVDTPDISPSYGSSLELRPEELTGGPTDRKPNG